MNIQSVVIAAAVSCSLVTSTVHAQEAEAPAATAKPARWELVVPSGSLLATGAQHGAIKNGNITAIQLTYVARPAFAITSMFGWARSRDAASAGNPKLDIFTYDVGAEARAPQWTPSSAVTFGTFAGVGAGGRSYNYRKLDVDATHNLAAYASAGGELRIQRVHLRLEARDYVSGFKPLRGEGVARTGNDVVLMAAVRLVSR